MPSKKVKKRKPKVTVTSTTKLKYEPDNFDIFLLNALKEKTGRTESGIIQMALMQLYIELSKETYPNWFPPNYIPGITYPDVNTPQWETEVKITCQNSDLYKSVQDIAKQLT